MMNLVRLRKGHLECLRATPLRPRAGAPAVVFVHGLGGGPWGWENFQRRFSENGYRSYALELPGHGPAASSAHDLGQITLETYALYVAAALAEIGRAVVIGHSMGGLIAQKLAETQSQAGFVFVASAPPWHMVRRAYWPLWRRLLRHPWRDILRPALRRPILLDRTLEDELVNNRLAADQRAAIYARDVPDSGRASLQMAAGLVTVDPRAVGSPCLVVAGRADGLIAVSECERLAAFYGCPLRLFDRGHMMTIEDGWEEVADSILEWIGALPPPDATRESSRDAALAT